MTATDGTFSFGLEVFNGDFLYNGTPNYKWILTLTKEEYADEEIDISPIKEPESTSTKNHICVAAYMRAHP